MKNNKVSIGAFLATLALIGLGFSEVVQSQGMGSGMKGGSLKLEAAKITGENICVGCYLAKKQGADSQCDLYGHRHALKVSEVMDEHGHSVMDRPGIILHYLATNQSKELMNGNHGANMEITGTVYGPSRILEVSSFKISRGTADSGTDKLNLLSQAFDTGSCCSNAFQAGNACNHPCCSKAIAIGKVCFNCNAGGKSKFMKMVLPARFDKESCCSNAHKAGNQCSHPCCVKAMESLQVCTGCNPGAKS